MRRLGLALIALFAVLAWLAPVVPARAETPAGPPFPEPVADQAVYDTAGLFTAATVADAEATIDRIEQRTGAEVVVYTQVKPGATTESTEEDAIALIDQWGVGRKGFDDGLAILMNVYTEAGGRVRGQVQLYAAPGFEALYLTNDERQQIFDEEMLPRLRDQEFDEALLVALKRIDAAATAERAGQLQLARQLDAVIGIIGGLGGFLLLVGYAFFHWRRYGRDPYVVDSPSIYLPAPPAELTAAGGALLHDGSSSRRTLTTALLDIASRDELAFRATDRFIGADEVTVELRSPDLDDPRIRLNRRNPMSPAEQFALKELGDASEAEGGLRVLDKAALLEFGKSASGFDQRIEAELVRRGWFTAAPAKVTSRWRLIGGVEIVAGAVAFWAATALPSGGFMLLALGLGAAGVFTFLLAGAMPARTLPGATMKAMLAAYRRTLQAVLSGARSMDEVVAEPRLAWLETPDRAVVWAVALGLQDEAQEVLQRSMEDLRAGRTSAAYLPLWYGTSGGGGGEGGRGGLAPGVMSSSAIPNLGGMFAALGTIGNTPSSSGSGGGFSGGSSGGGGGGAGGGF
ncbi:MAG TPA: TPM domain-containing protein [Candidatus Nanopelagicales bacterium]|nr:TPM domain-containing protein [Candidatus Nanopelagicales bacterium]